MKVIHLGQAWIARAHLPLVLKVKRLGERFPLQTERDRLGDWRLEYRNQSVGPFIDKAKGPQGQKRAKNDAPRIYRSTSKKAVSGTWEGKAKGKVAYNKPVVTHPTEVTLLASVLS